MPHQKFEANQLLVSIRNSPEAHEFKTTWTFFPKSACWPVPTTQYQGYLYQIWFCQPWPRSCQEQNWVHDNAYKFKSIPTHAPWNIFADLIWNQLHYMREETRPNIRHTTTIRWCFHQCGKHSTSNYLPALEEVDSDSVLKPEIWCEQSFILLERVVFVTFKWAGTDSSEKNFKDKCVGQVRDRTHALLSHSASTFSHKKFKYLQTQEW